MLVLCILAIPAFAGSPDLHGVYPAGLQRGANVALTLRGARLEGAAEIHFYQHGIAVKSLENTDANTVVAQCSVAPECPLGEHHLRLRTTTGLTELRTVWVTALPIVNEAEPNGEFTEPQVVPLNSTVSGVVTNEDIDYYAIEAKRGDRISAEIEAMRLGRAMFDPAIAILNADRFELAVADDSSLLLQDSTASIIAPEDGRYVIAVREAAFGGNDQSTYLLHIGSFPRPTVAYPPGAQTGVPFSFTLLGDPAGPITLDHMKLQASVDGMSAIFAKDGDQLSPSPIWLRVGHMPVTSEFRPVAPGDSGTTTSNATPPPTTAPAAPVPPVAFQGAISKAGEVDRFRFDGKKGVALIISAYARRLRSPLDAVLEVFDASGKWLAGNDDSAGADSVLTFTPPEDGEYEVRVRDHLGRGGETFVYRIELSPPQPSLELSLERIDSKKPQHLQAISVPKGNRFAALIRADRKNVGGAVSIEATGLPPGVTAVTTPVEADGALSPVLFEASAEASPVGSLADIKGLIAGTNDAANLPGIFSQTIPLVIAPPNETVYYQTTVNQLAVAVTEAAPFRIELAQPAAPILQNGVKPLKVHVQREPGFTGEIVLQMLWNPPGMSSVPTLTVAADKSDIEYQVSAAPDAPTKQWKLAILGHSTVNGGDVWVSTGLVSFSVEPPLFGGSLQMAATEQGTQVGVLCKLDSRRPFEGTARVTLLGLPPNTQCQPKDITAGATEVVFDLITQPNAPIGQHGNLFCELTMQQSGEILHHRLAGGGVLRIDAPPVAVAAEPEKKAPAPRQPAAPPKPLSRLEQLRKAAAEKAAATTEKPAQ
ncbi:MAG: PPC domain-containing protein [Planctomycetes bacterium]|nr:PPC domain-containing protein [Planctomycetota bacterium]